MTRKILILTVLASFLTTITSAQIQPGVVHQVADTFNRPVGDRDIESVNVPYSKRVDRVIDTRKRQNMVVNWPHSKLINIIHDAAMRGGDREGGVPVYTSDSLDFGSKVHEDSVVKLGGYYITIQIQNPDNPDDVMDYKDTTIFIPLDLNKVVKFRLMEEWVFDKKYSDFRPHIIAIAPLHDAVSSGSGIPLGELPLYWVKMEDLDPIFAKRPVFNPYNDSDPLTYEQWFKKRMFASYVIGESNVFDLEFKYMDGLADDPMEQLYRGEEIEQRLFRLEHDLWEY